METVVQTVGETVYVRISGELDIETTGDLEAALAEAEASKADRIVLDIERLEFVDSTGLKTIVAAQHRSEAAGDRLRFTRPRGHVADMFRLTALDQTLSFI